MNGIKILLFSAFIIIVGAGCNSSRNLFVEHDYSYESNFKTYSTYSFLECERDTGTVCTEVYAAIHRQMQARGYQLTVSKPTLLVNYSIFYDNVRYQGYTQPVIKNWVDTQDASFKYEPIKYSLDKGTIIISLIDAESDQIVWRGYAAGIFKNPNNVASYYKGVVRTIFDQYTLFAEGHEPSSQGR